MSCHVKLALRDSHRLQRVASADGRNSAKASSSTSWLSFNPDLVRASSKLFQLRRHHAIAQIHRRRRILHRPVVDHDQLLHIVRNRPAGIRRQLRRLRRLAAASSNRYDQ